MEGVWESQSCAPMYLIGWVNVDAETTRGLHIPCLLSFLAYQDIDATVTGLTSYPSDTWAPVNLTFQVYHLMIDLGSLFVPIGIIGLLMLWWKRRVFTARWLLWIFVFTIVLTELATLSGWWTAEFGRQPWIVWNLLRTADAESPGLSTEQVAFSLAMFVLLYALLFTLFIFLLNRKIQEGPDALDPRDAPESLPDTFREVFRRPRASAEVE
jgi:cytochrome d ubiquinol oxidase subunit I